MDVVRVKDNDVVVSGSLLCLRRDRSRGSGQVHGKDKGPESARADSFWYFTGVQPPSHGIWSDCSYIAVVTRRKWKNNTGSCILHKINRYLTGIFYSGVQ